MESLAYPVLAVTGKKGSGKDTIGKAVTDLLPVDTELVSFAYPLKSDAQKIFEAAHLYSAPELVTYISDNYVAIRETGNAEVAAAKAAVIAAESETPNAFGHSSQEVRKFLQWYGTEVGRAYKTDFWVSRAIARINKLVKSGKFVYIADSRFPDEITALRSVGAYIVRLEIDEDIRLGRLKDRDGFVPDAESLNHYSETALDDRQDLFNVIFNTGTDPVEKIANLVAATLTK